MPAFYPEGDEPKLADPSGRSLHKINNLLKSIDAKTGSATITGPVTVTNEVEIKNDANNPLPVSDNNGSLTVDGTVELGSTSLAALENISVTFPATQNVNVTNAGLNVSVTNLPATQPVSGSVSVSNFPATQPVSGTFWQATQPVSGSVSVSNFPATQAVTLASPPVTPVTDNGGSLTVDGTFWPATQPVSGTVSVSNLPATQPVSLATAPTTPVTGTFWQATQPVSIANPPVTPVTDNGGSLTVDGSITATQATAASLKAQAQLLNAAGSVVDYAMTGTAGTPATDVVTVQGISGGVSLPISGTVTASVSNFGSIATDIGGNAPDLGIQLGFAAGEEDYRHVGSANPLPIVGTVNTYPQQGTTATNTNFSSITSAQLAPAVANREALTVYNEGPGTLFINAGASCSTTSYQVRLFAGDYWEAPAGQLSLQHSGIFGTAGTARAVQVS
jgi:hypothetical protein